MVEVRGFEPLSKKSNTQVSTCIAICFGLPHLCDTNSKLAYGVVLTPVLWEQVGVTSHSRSSVCYAQKDTERSHPWTPGRLSSQEHLRSVIAEAIDITDDTVAYIISIYAFGRLLRSKGQGQQPFTGLLPAKMKSICQTDYSSSYLFRSQRPSPTRYLSICNPCRFQTPPSFQRTLNRLRLKKVTFVRDEG